MKKKQSIPDIPSNLPPDHQDFLQALKGNVNSLNTRVEDIEDSVQGIAVSGFVKLKTYYRLDPNVGPATTDLFSQNPLSTSPQIVNVSPYIPSALRGKVGAIDVMIEVYPSGSVDQAIFMTKPKGAGGSGNAYTRYGFLKDGFDRWMDEYRVLTDSNGDFEIWANTGTWVPRIARTLLRGIWTTV